jgi:hypothetical protein
MKRERNRRNNAFPVLFENAIDLVASSTRTAQASVNSPFSYLSTLVGAECDGYLPAAIGMTGVMSHSPERGRDLIGIGSVILCGKGNVTVGASSGARAD